MAKDITPLTDRARRDDQRSAIIADRHGPAWAFGHAAAAKTQARYSPGAQIDRADSGSVRAAVILSGWASEQRILPNGQRQIFSFLIPGDAIAVAPSSDLGDRAVIALTPLVLERALRGESPAADLQAISALREQRLLDHIVRLGSLSALQRAAHLLLELKERLGAAGQVHNSGFLLPVTQEALGEALGLSMVHVNRTFQLLRRQGLIATRAGMVTLLKPAALSALCGFSGHPELMEPSARAARGEAAAAPSRQGQAF